MSLDPSGPLIPDCQWPYKPRWELDGFDFSFIPVALHRQAVAAFLYRTSFTTITDQTRNKTAEAFSIRACNNAVVLFQALLFCRDYYPDPVFWRRVSQCMDYPGYRFIENVADMLVKARKAFRQYDPNPPNEAAKLADDWIAWKDSASVRTGTNASPSFQTPWRIRKKQWISLKKRGGLKDQGYLPIQTAAVETAGTSPMQFDNPCQLLGIAQESTYDVAWPAIKDEPGPEDNGRVTYDGSTDQESSRQSRKRQRSTTPNPRSAKRPATGANAVPVLASVDQDTPVDQDENEEDPTEVFLREWEASRTVEARLADCEEKSADQLNEIHDQDRRLSEQELRASQLSAKLTILDSRFITFKGVQTMKDIDVETWQRHQEAEMQSLRRSVEELTERLASGNSHIGAEVAEMRAFFEQEKDCLSTRLESFRDDLAVHKVRVGDCQKAVQEHVTERKNHETAVNLVDASLKKKIRLQRNRINEISDRLAELEKKLGDDVKEEDGNDDAFAQIEARLAHLTERITALETDRASPRDRVLDRHQSAIDKTQNRLGGLEASHAQLKKLVGQNSSTFGKKIAYLGDRLTKQERAMTSANANIASHHARLAQAKIGPLRNSAPL